MENLGNNEVLSNIKQMQREVIVLEDEIREIKERILDEQEELMLDYN